MQIKTLAFAAAAALFATACGVESPEEAAAFDTAGDTAAFADEAPGSANRLRTSSFGSFSYSFSSPTYSLSTPTLGTTFASCEWPCVPVEEGGREGCNCPDDHLER